MDDRSRTLLLGSVATLGILVAVGIVKVGTISHVGGVPAGKRREMNNSWSDDRRGAGTTNYTGGSGSLGVNLTIGGSDPDLDHYDPGGPDTDRQNHKQRYPARSGEVLESLMYGGPGMLRPPLPRSERTWMYAPPSGEDL